MNFVGNDGESEPRKSFWISVYVRKAEGTTSNFLVNLFGCYQVICNPFARLTALAHRVWPDVLLGDRRKLVA